MNAKIRLVNVLLVASIVFLVSLMHVNAQETNLTKIGDLEKEAIDQESNDALKEYYGEIFGIVGPGTRFNNIATKENIAILNVTIDGRDRRILTKLATGVVLPKITDTLFALRLQANNITVIDNLKVLGKTLFSAMASFGERTFYEVAGSEAKYVDEGFSRLANGKANISVNPSLRELITGYNVYLSPEGLTQGIYVSEKSASHFIVNGLNPESNVGFTWMLRGVKKDSNLKFGSSYAENKGISITASVNTENETTKVTINGLDKIRILINETPEVVNESVDVSANETLNQTNANETNQTGSFGSGIQLITGNVVDEFGLETDLGQILGNISTITQNTTSDAENNTAINDTIEEVINDTNNNSGVNVTLIDPVINVSGTIDSNSLEFTLYSLDEEFIIGEISTVTGLSASEVRKLITFVYENPVGFSDEVIEPQVSQIEGIEKVNGSVIVRLG
jgi:hypothetical protein